MDMKNWEWFGNAGHFICGNYCRFHLCTKVGDYLVSTVGEYWPDRVVREIHADVFDPAWFLKNKNLKGDSFDSAYMKKFGYEEIGVDRKYETMVFKAGKRCDSKNCKCGLPKIGPQQLDFMGYNSAGEAAKGHLALCKKWAREKR